MSTSFADQTCTPNSILEQRARVDETRARFIQTSESALLTDPQSVRGQVHYRKNERLVLKLHTSPPTDIHLTTSEIFIQKGASRNRLSLSTAGRFAQHLVAMLAFMSGDIQSLQSKFDIQFSGSCDRWLFLLQPRAQLGNRRDRDPEFPRVRMSGMGFKVMEIEVERDDASRTIIQIEDPTSSSRLE